jgi:hypothetical protein
MFDNGIDCLADRFGACTMIAAVLMMCHNNNVMAAMHAVHSIQASKEHDRSRSCNNRCLAAHIAVEGYCRSVLLG